MKTNKKYLILFLIVIVILSISTYIYMSNKEYTYICFNTEITKDTIIVEAYLDECITNKKISKNVITDKSELLTDDVFTSYRLTKESYKAGEMLYKEDFILYEEPKPSSENVNLLTELEVMYHGNSSEEFTKYKVYIKNQKLYAINLTTSKEALIFDKEKVKNIAVRPFCCAGEGYLLILTTTGNVYISEKDCNYWFSFDFPFKKLDGSNIVSLKLIPASDYDIVKNLYGIDSDGKEILLQKFN